MSDKPISDLRRRMIADMTVRSFGDKTQRDYIRHIETFARGPLARVQRNKTQRRRHVIRRSLRVRCLVIGFRRSSMRRGVNAAVDLPGRPPSKNWRSSSPSRNPTRPLARGLLAEGIDIASENDP
jgi:hypothetical protein